MTGKWITAYVDEDGHAWVERGVAPWPKIQREAYATLGDMGYDSTFYRRRYCGIEEGCRVSDERESPHYDDCREEIEDDMEEGEHLPDDWKPCCRTITAHKFEAVER